MSATFQALITTVGLNHEQMVDLAKANNIHCNAIIRSQCGRESTRVTLLDGHELITIEANDEGCSVNRNRLFELSNADYISFFDDDISLPDDFSEKIDRLVSGQPAEAYFFNVKRELHSSKYDNCRKGAKLSGLRFRSRSANRFMFLRDYLVRCGIKFDESIGPGAALFCGEDTVFLNELRKKGLKPVCTGDFLKLTICDDSSTWFRGYDAKYFFSNGYIYSRINGSLWWLFCLRQGLKLRKHLKNLKLIDAFSFQIRGHKEWLRSKAAGDAPTFERFHSLENVDETRVLVISHNPLSKEESNGRTLLNYLSGFPLEQVANLYINNASYRQSKLLSSFCVSDRDVFKSIFTRNCGKRLESGETEPINKRNIAKKRNRKNKTCFHVLIRDLLWRIGRPFSKRLMAWLAETKPNVIVCYSGDFPYLASLCTKISRFLKIPAVMVNTENYLLKDHDWLPRKRLLQKTICSNILQKKLISTFGHSFIENPTVYLTKDLLIEHSRQFFNDKSTWIGNSTNVKPVLYSQRKINNAYYFGNFGLGRSDSLAKIFQMAQKYNPVFQLICYGKGSETDIRKLKEAGIDYRGFLPYEDLMKEVGEKADLLIHCEGTDAYFENDTRNAFSTKIPDLLATGLPTLFYASDSFCFVRYLKENSIRFVAANDIELEDALKEIFSKKFSSDDADAMQRLTLVEKNHNLQRNAEKFKAVIASVLEKQ